MYFNIYLLTNCIDFTVLIFAVHNVNFLPFSISEKEFFPGEYNKKLFFNYKIEKIIDLRRKIV